MGPILRLSWLVGVQVGAKRGNLMLLGELRGAKLELKEALGGPRRRQEAPKGHWALNEGHRPSGKGSNFGAPGPPKVT